MQKFVLDTGVILGYIRAAGYADYIEKKYAPFTPPNIPLISVVSKGEIYDFDHLSNVFLEVIYIDQTLTAADI